MIPDDQGFKPILTIVSEATVRALAEAVKRAAEATPDDFVLVNG